MKRSDSIQELTKALARAQANFGSVQKSGRNPMFKSVYATFDDIVGAVRKPLSEAGLAYTQMLDVTAEGQPALTTALLHESGEWLEATVPLVTLAGNRGTNEAQTLGSTLTYMKRYALAAMLGVASDEDDDGNAAGQRRTRQAQSRQEQQAPAAQNDSTTAFVDVDEIGVFETQNGKRHLGFMASGHQWPDVRWWDGRDRLLAAAPWLAQTVSKDDLGILNARHEFRARVYYECKDAECRYKNAVRFEPRDDFQMDYDGAEEVPH